MVPAKGTIFYTFDKDIREKSNFDKVSVQAL
jgi:hypothetical protein